jgi:NodT family efflux transporter outer membrane factor (OMF) lipoprotein
MKKIFIIHYSLILILCLSGCNVYRKYTPPTETPEGLFGQVVQGDSSAAEMSWREFFTDPLLQQLIDSALARNTDIRSAQLTVQKAEASLRAAKLAYLPSLSFNPSLSIGGTVPPGGSVTPTWTYNIPLQIDWNIGISGSVTVNKRKAQAVLSQAQAQQQAMQANIISAVAQQYYMLLLLDRELEILIATDSLWLQSLETQRALWENGQSYSTAVNQMESSELNVRMQIVETRRDIRNIENSLCTTLAMTPRAIQRNGWGQYALPARFGTGVPAAMLERRPDIRLANHSLEEAFYDVASARAAFYPSISLQGILGWTNGQGAIADPGALLMQLLGSLTQPIFQLGKLKAQLKIAKYEQEDRMNRYVQTVIEAGNQVNEALADCQEVEEMAVLYRRQVEVLQEAYAGTHELMNNGKASYLEVLTAQESLLTAQLNEVTNLYNGSQALIGLYIALGGATK